MTRFNDVYATITAQVIADLERGVRPWSRSWSSSPTTTTAARALPRRSTGDHYRGVNVLVLWMAALANGFDSPTWMTFQQAKQLGGSVRKGEKATHVLYFDQFTVEDPREGREGESRSIRFAKAYAVFNVQQIEGLPERFHGVATPASPVPAAAFFSSIGATVQHGGDQPMYMPQRDVIRMPRPEQFRSPDAYAATLGHELVHWTGHVSRLDRSFDRFGTEAYALEELVAELGAAFLCATLGIADTQREDHAAYLAHYLRLLRNDSPYPWWA